MNDAGDPALLPGELAKGVPPARAVKRNWTSARVHCKATAAAAAAATSATATAAAALSVRCAFRRTRPDALRRHLWSSRAAMIRSTRVRFTGGICIESHCPAHTLHPAAHQAACALVRTGGGVWQMAPHGAAEDCAVTGVEHNAFSTNCIMHQRAAISHSCAIQQTSNRSHTSSCQVGSQAALNAGGSFRPESAAMQNK